MVPPPRGVDLAADGVDGVHVEVDESHAKAADVPRAGLHGESI